MSPIPDYGMGGPTMAICDHTGKLHRCETVEEIGAIRLVNDVPEDPPMAGNRSRRTRPPERPLGEQYRHLTVRCGTIYYKRRVNGESLQVSMQTTDWDTAVERRDAYEREHQIPLVGAMRGRPRKAPGAKTRRASRTVESSSGPYAKVLADLQIRKRDLEARFRAAEEELNQIHAAIEAIEALAETRASAEASAVA